MASPNYIPSSSQSIIQTVVVTPSDTTTIPPTKSLLIVSGGTVVLQCVADRTPQTFTGLPAYTELAFAVVTVMATGTTATDIRACY